VTRRWLAGSAAVVAAAALGSACSGTTNTGVIELNLDRPVDVSFACYGQMKLANGQIASANTAMPTAVCQALSPQRSSDPIAPYPGQDGLSKAPSWYGFILQSASGTVALTTWPASPADSLFVSGSQPQQVSDTPTSVFEVLDADPVTPGKNAISIGEDPVAIVTDKTGCFEVTANAGSCDLSELDITSTLANVVDGNPARPKINRVTVTGPDGRTPILARPSAMVGEPFLDVTGGGTDAVGNACLGAATSKVYIAYPSCNLVAEIRLGGDAANPTATVIGGIKFDPNGIPRVITDQTLAADVSCPVECAPPSGPAGSSSGGVRPVALDYRLDTQINAVKTAVTSRLAIGADTRGVPLAAPITVVDLQLTGDSAFAPVPGSVLSIPLEANGGMVGVSALALSPQIGMGSNASTVGKVNDNVDDQGQYVYAVASDGTVRVADVLSLKRECDTQIDGRFLLRNPTVSTTLMECLPVGRPDLPRRPGVRSPGIELPDGIVANSVTIIKGVTTPPLVLGQDLKPTTTPVNAQPSLLLGYFAFITASSGDVYVANVNDDDVLHDVTPTKGHTLATSPVLVMPHQLRDSLSKRESLPKDCTTTDPPVVVSSTSDPTSGDPGGPSEGGPRLTATPIQQSVAGTLPDDLRFQLPRLQQVACDLDGNVPITPLEFGAAEVRASAAEGPAPSRDLAYPDLKTVLAEDWTLTYEGTLEIDSTINSINGPPLRFGQTFVDRNGMFIQDASRPFCAMGVEPFDIVEFRGCNPANLDGDCPSGYTCYVHPQSIVGGGACFLKSEAPRLQDVCRDFLSSVRRYTVGIDPNGGTAPDKLVLWQRKHELSTTPIDGCVSDDQCDDLARAAFVLNPSADPFVEAAAGTPVKERPTHWSCMADPLRKPISTTDPARNKRCVQVCSPPPANPDDKPGPACAVGMVCAPDPTSVTGRVCMEGVEPPQACLNGPQRYAVRAGEAFTVIGSRSGFVHPIVASGNRCIVDPNLAKDPLSVGRIPLHPPACQSPPPNDPSFPFTGRIDSTTFEANPCLLTVPQLEIDQGYPDPITSGGFGSCRGPAAVPATAMTPQPNEHPILAIKYRNRAMTMTIVDPYREAAQSCLKRDPIDTQTQAPIPSNIPLVVPGYQIVFGVKAGYLPITMALLGRVSPVKVVRGPSESIWVIDDGDVLAQGFNDVSTRGQVFRIESVPPSTMDGFTDTIINTLR
jgi:hypothetical protein